LLNSNTRKLIWSWALFDFANSSYSAVIGAVIFPVYYSTYIVGEKSLGDLLWGRAISLSMFLAALMSPFLGSSRDITGYKKKTIFALVFLGSLSVSGFAFLKPLDIYLGFWLVVLANFSLETSLVIYNAYLPEVIPVSYWGRVSAWGFGLGYLGSIFSLIIALYFLNQKQFSFIWLTVSLFWILFSLPLLFSFPADIKGKFEVNLLKKAYKKTFFTLKEVFKNKNLRFFFLSYFFYLDGVNTVIIFSSLFAYKTLGFNFKELVYLYLLVQFTSLLGCFILAKPFDKFNLKKIISFLILFWFCISLLTFFTYAKTLFWVVATLAGLGLGSIQAGSRAFFSALIPSGQEGSYFGFYGLVGKSSAILGPLGFGLVSYIFKSQRPAVLWVGLLFLLGYLFFKQIDSRI